VTSAFFSAAFKTVNKLHSFELNYFSFLLVNMFTHKALYNFIKAEILKIMVTDKCERNTETKSTLRSINNQNKAFNLIQL